jgi:triacylglycerol lipase
MSVLVSLPRDVYRDDAMDRFSPDPGFAMANAQAMVWLSQLAYETDDPKKIEEVLTAFGLKRLRIGPNSLTDRRACFIVARGRGATFVAFAGTDPLKPQDYVSDLLAVPTLDGFHSGFFHAVDVVKKDIMEAIGSREQPLFFTGHSMGGALANIAAILVHENGFQAPVVYTFGGARAGIQDYFDRYKATLRDRAFRLVHGDDIVATVPPSLPIFNFRHVGHLLQCPSGQRFVGEPSASNDSNDPNILRAGLDALLDTAKRVPSLDATLSGVDPRTFDKSGLIPIPLRDHVPASYFRALQILPKGIT